MSQYWVGWRVLAGHNVRNVMRIKRLRALDMQAYYVRRKRRHARIITALYGQHPDIASSRTSIIAPLAIDIVNGFTNSNNSSGQRAWPEITGEPPVFGNFIGEFGHTGGGSYIWTGFTWERAILGG